MISSSDDESIKHDRGVPSSRSNESVERVNANTSCYRWKIKYFSEMNRDPGYCIYSPSLQSIDSKVRWSLKLFPNGKGKGKSDSMVLGIYYCSPTEITAFIELSVVNIDNEVVDAFKVKKTVVLNAQYLSHYNYRCGEHFGFGRRNEIEDPRNNTLVDSCLTISFDVTFHDPIVVLPIANNSESLENTETEFNDFGKLLDDAKFSDVTFKVGGKKIHAHKAILGTRSPVFNAMFQHEMQETQRNVVEIVDIDYATMKQLFQFLYTGAVDEIENAACELLVAAEKYCVERLKALCEKTILRELKIDNAVECLITADRCNATNLKKKVLEFIAKNSGCIVDSEAFGSLSHELMWEATRAVSRRKTNTF